MQKYIALLRGINVSGQKKIKMADLRASLSDTGFQNTQTYIQSGNIVFESTGADRQKLSDQIEKCILDSFGFLVPVTVIPKSEFEKILTANPFRKEGEDTKPLYVVFLFDSPAKDRVEELKTTPTGNDQYELSNPFIFMKYPEGIGKSKMDNNFFERKLGVRATTRNWNTIIKLSSF